MNDQEFEWRNQSNCLITIREAEEVLQDGGSAEVDHPAGVAQLLVDHGPGHPLRPCFGVTLVTYDVALESFVRQHI